MTSDATIGLNCYPDEATPGQLVHWKMTQFVNEGLRSKVGGAAAVVATSLET
jgi:hypothetical protein